MPSQWPVTGVPTLTSNDGVVAAYASGSGTGTLVFTHTVGAGNSAATLAITAVNLNGGTIIDIEDNAAVLMGAVRSFSGLSVNGG